MSQPEERAEGSTPWARVLRKIDDYRWEIPTTYKPGMRVPGRIYADERMVRQIVEEQALDQVANVATLPGIVGYSFAMPDVHWGYGFPVGGVAAFDPDDGVISPGGVGYDVNCLSGDSRVLHRFGYHRSIEDFSDCWTQQQIKCVNPHTDLKDTAIVAFLRAKPAPGNVFRLVTESGREIVATADHPFLTPDGMVPLSRVAAGDRVSVYPFEGVRYESPGDEVIVTEHDVAVAYPGNSNGLHQIIATLRKRSLLPLRMDHPALPHIVRLMGVIQGDGHLEVIKNRAVPVTVYGRPEDLADIRRDIAAIGFAASRVYRRTRSHKVKTRYGIAHFTHEECSIHAGSPGLAVLLRCLGVTVGSKAAQDFDAPAWLDQAPLWLRRLYLAALFGAELSSPSIVTGHARSMQSPLLSMNKRRGYEESGRRFLLKIGEWLQGFGVQSALLRSGEEYVSERGDVSLRLRLQISMTPENLIRLWSRVGFEYNRRKQYLSNVGVQYLRLKQTVLAEREHSIEVARRLKAEGQSVEHIMDRVTSVHVNRWFVERSLWRPRKTSVRIGAIFAGYREFLEDRTKGLGETGQVWDAVVLKEAVHRTGLVYDFTVADPNHNFIANAFVVSNCGVRMIRTGLTEPEVRPRVENLVEALFRAVPSGVGSGGRVRVSMSEIDAVLKNGSGWAAEAGYAWPRDLEVTEANGALPQADPDQVSPEAKQRGRGQVGTLGSGNHFLEVQVVDEIFDEPAAEAMRLFPGQVVVFIHCGSRGLGHQVCTDFLRTCERANAQKYHITLADRQLACVPFGSPEGTAYFGAMCAAANFAWANRQVITHWTREAFARVFGRSAENLGMDLVYDVAHNIAKVEEYDVGGRRRKVVVHRKGATRAFPPGHPEVPARYRGVGQPVLIPGDMGRYSFVAVGTAGAVAETFGSTCHGAGRVMGRKAATRALAGVDVAAELRQKGIVVRAQDHSLLAEEASQAYKDVADVVEVCQQAGISRRVARMRPIGVLKG